MEQLNKEKEEASKAKATKGTKGKKINDLIDLYGGFFFFGSDGKVFREKYNKLKEFGKVEDGDKVTHLFAGLYVPSKHKEKFLKV